MVLNPAHNYLDGSLTVVKKIVLAALWVTAAIQILSLFSWPDDGTDWATSLAWGSLLIPSFGWTGYQAFKYKSYTPLAAIALCAVAWSFGFISRFDLGVDALVYIFLSFLLVFTQQWKTVNISLCMAALGVVMFALNTTNTWWYVGINVLFGLTLISTSVKHKKLNAPKTRAVYRQEQSKAA